MVKNDASEPPARKHARDAASFRVLRREVKKMRDLNGFQERAITLFDKNLRYLSSKGARDRLVPDGYYLALIRVVDLLSKVREHCSVVYPPSNNTGPLGGIIDLRWAGSVRRCVCCVPSSTTSRT